MTLAFIVAIAQPGRAQKHGGTPRIYHRDNLPSASIHEEATISTVAAFMGVFNALVLFDQSRPLNTADRYAGRWPLPRPKPLWTF